MNPPPKANPTRILFAAMLAGCASPPPPVSQKLDDVDYHAESAAEAGRSEYAGGAHIAYVLVWTAERDLVAPDLSDAAVMASVADRASDAFEKMLDWHDGALTTDTFGRDGAAFASSCYDRYVDEYAAAFGDRTYHDPNWRDYETAAGLLDALRRRGCA